MSTSIVETAVYFETVEVMKDVEIKLQNSIIKVKGPLGEVSKDFSHTGLKFVLEDNILKIISVNKGKKFKSMVTTIAKLIKNMMEGVLYGHMVKLKIVYSHFPITVKYDKSTGIVSIYNFMGEKSPRKFRVPFRNIDVNMSGQDIVITGLDKNEVTQVATMFELATKIKNKDLRVYIDGIYVIKKGLWKR